MPSAQLIVAPAFGIAPVEPRPFGSFVGPMGRFVHTGSYQPQHRSADATLRIDVPRPVSWCAVSFTPPVT